MMRRFWIINGILFQLAWFSAALLNQYAAVLIGIILLLHFLLSDKRQSDVKLMLLAPLGWIADSILIHFSVLTTSNGWLPIWLALLWCVFVISLNHSLLWLSKLKLPFLVLIGVLSGAASYTAAIRFGALGSPLDIVNQLTYFCILWGLLLPILVNLAKALTHSQQPFRNAP